MSDDTFRIIISAAVGLACVAFVVQAIVVIALYAATRKMQRKVSGFVESAEPLLQKVEPLAAKIEPLVNEAEALMRQGTLTLEKARPMLDKAPPLIEKGEAVVNGASAALASVNRILEEARPRVADISEQAVGIAKSGREQVERIGDLLHDASERASARLEKIDHSVEKTVEQVEAVKRAVMRPVREVNAVAAGVSAVLSTLVGRPRKSSVDSATQDEEMFI